MKGKRYTTKDKSCTVRDADGGKNIAEECKGKNIAEVTFHRWTKQFSAPCRRVR